MEGGRAVRIGVDFGGTKIEAAALDDVGRIVARRRIANPGAYDPALLAVRQLVEAIAAETAAGPAPVGVGGPGSISPRTGLMRNANTTWLNGRTFQADLAQALGREVRIANDANCLALSEAMDGAGAGQPVVFAVVIGTGCGGGLVVNGRIVEGGDGVAGEWGHTPLPWMTAAEFPGHACWCGRRGCVETYVSGPGFAADFERASGRRLSAEAVTQAALAGDGDALAALDRYIDRLGRGLAVVCDIVDPDVIVLGGGVSNVPALYERLPEAIGRHVFSDDCRPRVAPALHGDSSGVRGAAWLWPSTLVETGPGAMMAR